MDASAQLVATSLDQLQPLLKQGDIVEIIEGGGQRVKGRVLDLSPSALNVQVLGANADGRDASAAQRRLLEGDLRQIRLERRDSLWNGTLIGLGVAAVPGILTIAYGLQAADDGYTTGPDIAGAGLFMLGIGAGIGAAVDAAMRHRTTVFFRPPAPAGTRVQWSPLLSPSAAGVRVAMRF
jgi:hypothetical protein